MAIKPDEQMLTVGYARVSSAEQKEDLEHQKQVLELFCAKNGWQLQIVEDLGSGLNYNKKGVRRLIQMIANFQVERLVLTHKDRLLRWGSELVFSLCEHFGCEIVIINRTEGVNLEEELAKDVLEIITVFSARL